MCLLLLCVCALFAVLRGLIGFAIVLSLDLCVRFMLVYCVAFCLCLCLRFAPCFCCSFVFVRVGVCVGVGVVLVCGVWFASLLVLRWFAFLCLVCCVVFV